MSLLFPRRGTAAAAAAAPATVSYRVQLAPTVLARGVTVQGLLNVYYYIVRYMGSDSMRPVL